MTAEPDPRVPASYPRRIVVASLGLNPQVLTETLYCLGKPHPSRAEESEPPFVPTEIHVVTTEEGRERVMLTLLHDSTAILAALESDHGLNGHTGHAPSGPDSRGVALRYSDIGVAFAGLKGGKLLARQLLRRARQGGIDIGGQIQRFLVIGARADLVTHGLIGPAPPGKGRYRIRQDSDGFVIVDDGPFEVAALAPGIATQDQRDNRIGIELQRFVQVGERAIKIALQPPNLAAIPLS
jgi:hypothetical protein